MKRITLFFTCALLVGCSRSLLLTKETEKDIAVREMLFRRAMVGPKGQQVWFIDYGHGKDPPPNFLKRFSDLSDPVKNVSEAKKDKFGSVRDLETGKRGYIVHARIIRWIDDETAKVEYGAYHNGLAAHGGKGVVRFEDGKWILKPTGMWKS